MPASRRGSGSITLPTGQTLAIHTRTSDEPDLPHATKKFAVRFTSFFPGADRAIGSQDDGRPSEEIREHVRRCVPRPVAGALTDRTRSFTLTPQRMRMIVEAFKETLETGLQKPKQVVVRDLLP